jgi:TetR/AcrR family transcriptional regulator
VPRGRKRAENPETARRILHAAEHLFAERGLAGARTEEIASVARANKAMLYYYFGSKERLHRAVLENLLGELTAIYQSAGRASCGPAARLLLLVNAYFDFLVSHPNYPRLMQRQVMQSEFDWIARRYFVPFHQELSRTIREGIRAHEMRSVDPDHTVFTIVGMTIYYFAAATKFGPAVGRNLLAPRAVEQRRRTLLDFLAHGLFLPKVTPP